MNNNDVVQVDVGEALGVSNYEGFMMPTFGDFDHVATPKGHDGYLFKKNVTNDILKFLKYPAGCGLWISGPQGSGKTTSVTEILARLGWPAQVVAATSTTEFLDFVGQAMPVVRDGKQSFEFIYGPLAKAMKEGHVLLINEWDLVDPGENAGLHDVIEGKPLVIPTNGGEIIQPHPLFRVIVTGNGTGQGDLSGNFSDVKKQNMATMDRFLMTIVDYPTKEEEIEILKGVAPRCEIFHDRMIDVANGIRKQFKGESGDQTLSCTMSTRVLINWSLNFMMFSSLSDQNPLAYALDHVLTNKVEEHERVAVHRIAKDIFADQWDPQGQKAA